MRLLLTLIKKIQGALHVTSATRLNENLWSIIKNPLLSKQEIHTLIIRARKPKSTSKQSLESTQMTMGEVNSVYRGLGLDYEESRQYQPGDDPRHMNWQLAARTDALYMKVYREEKRPGVFILIDRRESMRFGTKIRLKVTQAARIATVLAFSAQQRSAVIGGVILNSKPHWLHEAQSEQEVFSWVSDVCSPCPPLSRSPNATSLAAADGNLNHILRLLQSKISPGSTLYIISDFVELTKQHYISLANLAARHSVHAIHVYDPAELHLPKAGQLHLYPGSTNPTHRSGVTIDTESITTRRDYRKAALTYFEKTEQNFRSLGISYVKISTLLDNIENRIPLL